MNKADLVTNALRDALTAYRKLDGPIQRSLSSRCLALHSQNGWHHCLKKSPKAFSQRVREHDER